MLTVLLQGNLANNPVIACDIFTRVDKLRQLILRCVFILFLS